MVALRPSAALLNARYVPRTYTLSPSRNLAVEKPRGSNEHPAGDVNKHRNDNVDGVPVSEDSSSMAIFDLGPGDTLSIRAKSVVLGRPKSFFRL